MYRLKNYSLVFTFVPLFFNSARDVLFISTKKLLICVTLFNQKLFLRIVYNERILLLYRLIEFQPNQTCRRTFTLCVHTHTHTHVIYTIYIRYLFQTIYHFLSFLLAYRTDNIFIHFIARTCFLCAYNYGNKWHLHNRVLGA